MAGRGWSCFLVTQIWFKPVDVYNINIRMKESSLSGMEGQIELLDKSNPFDKLITNDQLTYLPNLYLRQFKLVEDLIRLRQDFPEQKVLLPRNNTRWDNLLDQMKHKSKLIAEVRKYKIAEKFHVARQARLEVQRHQLRKEEQYHFHRLVCSSLSDAVVDHFQQQKNHLLKQEDQEDDEIVEKVNPIKKHQDDIFVDGGDDYSYAPEQNNLLDDLLNENIVEKKIEDQVEKQVQIEPVSFHVQYIYRRDREAIDMQPQFAISRKSCLKRINESVRKRLKIKQEEEEQPGRSLSSATVFLSSWMNIESEPKAQSLIELPSQIQWLFSSEKQRKKRDDDTFDLKWNAQQIEKMQKRNQKFNIRKGKIDNNILVLSMNRDEEEYRKCFEKNIASEKTFPPTLRNVQPFKMQTPRRFYNEFHDRDYELFIMENNKRKILKEFSEKANMIFPQNYSHDEIDQNESINTGKIFVHPPNKVLNRIIYKISDYKLTVSVKNELKVSTLDIDRMILMTFLVKKYLSKFGNVWKSITQFISMSEYFSNIYVTQQLVQQVYQLVSKYENDDNRLSQLELWDKKILPYNNYGSHSYKIFDQSMYEAGNQYLMNEHKMDIEDETAGETEYFDFDRYEEVIREPVRTPKEDTTTHLGQQFERFYRKIHQNVSRLHLQIQTKNREDQNRKIRTTLERFRPNDDIIPYDNDDDSHENDRVQINSQLSENLRGEIKVGTPFRKKKNINERNNELVKILQALRNKNVPPGNGPMPKKVEEPIKPVQAAMVKPNPAVGPPMAPKPVENPDPKKQIQKSPDKKLGAPSKKDRKNKDPEDKKG